MSGGNLPVADLVYVRANCPHLVDLAARYNDARLRFMWLRENGQPCEDARELAERLRDELVAADIEQGRARLRKGADAR